MNCTHLFKSLLALFVLFSILFPFVQSNAQAPAPYVPNVIPPSPNAASLMKFSDVPVSPYTGTADITIPLYNIQLHGMSIPVSLSYHSGGIKLREEAGNEGLGWTLDAGGMISRTIMDQDDFAGSYFTGNVPQVTGDFVTAPYYADGTANLGIYGYDFICNYKVYTDVDTVDFYNALSGGPQAFDLESDIFSFNFLGRSGKFIISRDGHVILQKQENLVIQYGTNGSSFTITDDQGNKFFFDDLEYTTTTGQPQLSSWLLSKIVTEQNDTARFTYNSSFGTVSVIGDLAQVDRIGCPTNQTPGGPTSIQSPSMSYTNTVLQSISFLNGQVNFSWDNTRTDLQNGVKLDSVKIYSKSSSGLTYVKEHDFFYSYFNGGQSYGSNLEFERLRLDSVREASGTLVHPAYSFLYNLPPVNNAQQSGKHSYSVDHWGYYNGVGNSGFIPTIVGVFSTDALPAYFLTYNGADRDPDPTSMLSFSLQQLTYPTGGSTQFTYQPNDYDFNNSINGPQDFPDVKMMDTTLVLNISAVGQTTGSIDLSKLYPLAYTGNATMTIAFIATTNNGDAAFRNTLGKLYFNFGNINTDISSTSLSCPVNSPACSVTIPLNINTAGLYSWVGYIDASIGSGFSEIHVTVSWDEPWTQHYNNPTLLAGGLRIQTVTDFSATGVIAKERSYNYGYSQDKLGLGTPQQYSYGRLMSTPSYARYEVVVTGALGTGGVGYAECTGLTLTGSSNSSVTSVIQGNIVGYDHVEESTMDPVTGADIGKTVYNFYNSCDTSLFYYGYRAPGSFNMGNSLNGMVLSKIEYSDNQGLYNKVHEEDNYYHTANRLVYYSQKCIDPTSGGVSQGGPMSACPGDTTVNDQLLSFFYPSIKSERILQDSTYAYAYDQINPANYTLSVKRNYYDNPVHYQLTRSSTVDSKGNTLTNLMRYPQDFIPKGSTHTGNTILDSMIGRNMISEVIEKQDSLYYFGSSTGYITGAQLRLYRMLSTSCMNPDKTYNLDIQAPITNFQGFSFVNNATSMDSRYRQMISFDAYDNSNNIQQYTTTDQNPVTYIWDYTNEYPIAQVKNAVLSDVAATSFESSGTGNWTFTGTSTADTTSITGKNCYNLGQTSGTITKTGLTSANTYILSYWTKNASAYTITGTVAGYPIKGKTIKGWTYFEHKITGQSTVTVSGSGFLDELRLYPATAQMVTYTYLPLVGMTTSCDAGNKVAYYFYDAFQRLKWIKDQDGNIIKTFQYHYENQTGPQ
jgi:hypothetical protein